MPVADEVEGALTWRYVGQVRYPHDPQPPFAQWVVEEPDTRSTLELLLATTRTDAYGRRWQVVAVDQAALEAELDAYDALSDEPNIVRYPLDAPRPSEGVEEYWWEPQTWNTDTCSGDEIHRWDADDRNKIIVHPNDELTDRQKTIVVINVVIDINSPPGSCTGVMVSDNDVLTAAHCVTDGSGNEYARSSITVCTWGNQYTDAECKVGLRGF